MTHTDAKVEFLHDCALEFEGKAIGDGSLEIVRELDGRLLVQIYCDDVCARAWISDEEYKTIVTELG